MLRGTLVATERGYAARAPVMGHSAAGGQDPFWPSPAGTVAAS